MVVRPPRSDPKASGINKREAGTPVLRATEITTGNMKAATPILFMKADSTPELNMMTTIILTSVFPANFSTCFPTIPATPVSVNPSLRMNMAQTVITAALLNPEIASVGVTRPVKARATNTSRATMSMRTISEKNQNQSHEQND